jgi:hypothetical protein
LVIYFILPLLAFKDSCLDLAAASLALLAVSLTNLAFGFNLNNAVLEVNGFFFYLKCMISGVLASLTTD